MHAEKWRPTDYSDQLADEICVRIISGRSLNKVCRDEDMPCRDTAYLWLSKHTYFSDKYTLAAQIRVIGMLRNVAEKVK